MYGSNDNPGIFVFIIMVSFIAIVFALSVIYLSVVTTYFPNRLKNRAQLQEMPETDKYRIFYRSAKKLPWRVEWFGKTSFLVNEESWNHLAYANSKQKAIKIVKEAIQEDKDSEWHEYSPGR